MVLVRVGVTGAVEFLFEIVEAGIGKVPEFSKMLKVVGGGLWEPEELVLSG